MVRGKKDSKKTLKKVQTFGRKKNAVAVALCEEGFGMIRVNGVPVSLVQPEGLRLKLQEPLLLLGKDSTSKLNIRLRVRGGGQASQVYAVRQAIAKSFVAYAQKYVDEATKQDLKKKLASYDKSLLVADPRRREAKKFGGHGARARRAKSYR